jgi:hypothetical protein
MRYGLDDGVPISPEAVAQTLGVSRQRLYQIEREAASWFRGDRWREIAGQMTRTALASLLKTWCCGVITETERRTVWRPIPVNWDGDKTELAAIRFIMRIIDTQPELVPLPGLWSVSQEAANKFHSSEELMSDLALRQNRTLQREPIVHLLGANGFTLSEWDVECIAERSPIIGIDHWGGIGLRTWPFFERRNWTRTIIAPAPEYRLQP